jgi:diguanylate cyclase (GGDEF)-like protein
MAGDATPRSREDELRRLRDISDRKLAQWLLSIGVVVGAVQVPLNLAEGREGLAAGFGAFAVLLATGELMLGRAMRPHTLALLGLVGVLGIELYGGALILESGLTAYMPWIFVFVPVAIGVAGLAGGLALCGLLAVFLWTFRMWRGTAIPDPMFDEMMFVFVALASVVALYEALRGFYERLLARLHRRLADLAALDQLTRVYNRHTIHELLSRELHRVRDGAPAFAVVLFDLDHFKRVNDTHGHEAGDRVLRLAALTTAQSIRASDTLGRWGGEEFLVLCTGTSLEEARAVAERVRVSLEEAEVPEVGAVTASFGVARLRAEDEIADVVRRADEALYDAKRSGRNTIGARP